jgi:hypothetical protein
MLNPNCRSLYTGILTPPPEMVLDEAICTTFSLDPFVMLFVPLHLSMLAAGRGGTKWEGISLLESIERLSSRITIYTQKGRLQVPKISHVMYGLLESMMVEVKAPLGGVFHPKLWVLRFVNVDDSNQILIRLAVLSRNLTQDKSWDLSLVLEGTPGRRYVADNREIGELISDLPNMATDTVNESRILQAKRLGDEVRHVQWELPAGFEMVAFKVLGRRKKTWVPVRSNRLAVISPFCGNKALKQIAETSRDPVVLISRPETLRKLKPETCGLFSRCFVLNEAAETEDGEDIDTWEDRDTRGLHAKAYISEKGWNTRIDMGSANATDAALLGSKNIEVVVSIVGKRSAVGSIETLYDVQNLGAVLSEFKPSDIEEDEDLDQENAEEALEKARDALVDAQLSVGCEAVLGDERWALYIEGDFPRLNRIACCRMWPITVDQTRAVTIMVENPPRRIELGKFGAASLTGLIAVELQAVAKEVYLRFTLNLPTRNFPEARRTAILKTVVRNQDGFLRYLMLLLGEEAPEDGNGGTGIGESDGRKKISENPFPLLEEMVRAFSRRLERLEDIRRVVKRLTEDDNATDFIPVEFLEMWQVFEQAMKGRNR